MRGFLRRSLPVDRRSHRIIAAVGNNNLCRGALLHQHRCRRIDLAKTSLARAADAANQGLSAKGDLGSHRGADGGKCRDRRRWTGPGACKESRPVSCVGQPDSGDSSNVTDCCSAPIRRSKGAEGRPMRGRSFRCARGRSELAGRHESACCAAEGVGRRAGAGTIGLAALAHRSRPWTTSSRASRPGSPGKSCCKVTPCRPAD